MGPPEDNVFRYLKNFAPGDSILDVGCRASYLRDALPDSDRGSYMAIDCEIEYQDASSALSRLFSSRSIDHVVVMAEEGFFRDGEHFEKILEQPMRTLAFNESSYEDAAALPNVGRLLLTPENKASSSAKSK